MGDFNIKDSEESVLDDAYKTYKNFEDNLKYGNRFFISEEINNIFEDVINAHKENINLNNILYRARIHDNDEDTKPYISSDIGMPPSEFCGVGRLNPKGIRVFYLAGSREAAVAEVRPNIGNIITIGRFNTIKDMNIVKFQRKGAVISHKDEWKCGKSTEFILYFSTYLSIGFSKIINSKDKELEYLPTQAFAEYCKKLGIDGISFSSSVYDKCDREGFNKKIKPDYNYVFFNDDGIEFIDSELIKIKDIEYSY